MNRERIERDYPHAIDDSSIVFPDEIKQYNTLSKIDQIGTLEEAGILQDLMAEFKTAYETAQRLVNGDSELIYRLDLTTEDLSIDDVYASKIGGLPDLSGTLSKVRYFDEKAFNNDRSVRKFNLPTVEQFVLQNWPHCPTCLRPMRFLAQINFWDWLVIIHQVTSKDRYTSWAQRSAMCSSAGLLEKGVGILKNQHLMIWHCSSRCDHGQSPRVRCKWSNNSWAALKFKERLQEMEAEFNDNTPSKKMEPINPDQAFDMFGNPFPWTITEYQKAVMEMFAGETRLESFNSSGVCMFSRVIKNQLSAVDDGLPSILSPKKIINMKIGFDLADMPNCDAPNDELFKRRADFVLFGKGRSQQEPRSPFCSDSYYGPHRMAPLISYNEVDEDLTHQIYSCLTCGDRNYFSGILDTSLT